MQYQETEGNPVLLLADVIEFLEWLKSYLKRIELEPGIALQDLCGLQMQEALRLTWNKIDLDQQFIVIDGVVKNQWRIQKIPIPDYAADILRIHQEVNDPNDHQLFPFYEGDYRGYSKVACGFTYMETRD